MEEILFIVNEDHDGFHARAVGAGIFTEGDSREELVNNVRDAVFCHYDSPAHALRIAHLHFVRDETIANSSGTTEMTRAEIVEKLRGSVLKDEDPYGPAAPLEDWEALKSHVKTIG